MKKIIPISFTIVPSFILFFCTASVSEKKTSFTQSNNVTVLELFTSQGCSSCPPADRLLGKYTNNDNIIPLSFHVDYWNRLGWTDPFSNAAFSQRQKNYASIFKSGNIYTPQLVINGESEMVGSNENKISSTIESEGRKKSTALISINEVKIDNNKAIINCTVQSAENNSDLNIALVQAKAITSIKAGENGGRELTNYNVVRNFKTLHSIASGKNSMSIDLIPGGEKKDYSIVTFLQDPKTYRISAAAKSAL